MAQAQERARIREVGTPAATHRATPAKRLPEEVVRDRTKHIVAKSSAIPTKPSSAEEPVTDEGLRYYLGRLVKLQFASGEVFIGRLMAGDPKIARSHPYELKLPGFAPSESGTLVRIPEASIVASVQMLKHGLPSMSV